MLAKEAVCHTKFWKRGLKQYSLAWRKFSWYVLIPIFKPFIIFETFSKIHHLHPSPQATLLIITIMRFVKQNI